MRKGIRRAEFFPPAWDIERCLEAAAQAGFEGMELIYRPDRGAIASSARVSIPGMPSRYHSWQKLAPSITSATTEAECLQIKRAASDSGIEVVSLATGYSAIDEPGSQTFGEAYEAACSALTRTSWLGGSAILVAFEQSAQATANDSVIRSWIAVLLKELSVVAQEKNVRIGYELVWPAAYGEPTELLSIFREVQSEFVGCYFDPANVVEQFSASSPSSPPAYRPEDWLRELLPYVVRVHMKDYGAGLGPRDLLAGDVNWSAIRELLIEGSYSGWLVAETEVEPEQHLQAVGYASDAMDRFIGGSF